MKFEDSEFACGADGRYQRSPVTDHKERGSFQLSDWARCFSRSNVWGASVASADSDQMLADDSRAARY